MLNNLGTDAGELNVHYRGLVVVDQVIVQVDVDAAIPPQHVPNAGNEDISTEETSDVEVYDADPVTGVQMLGPEVSSAGKFVDADSLDTATDPVEPTADDNDAEADFADVEETKDEPVENARRYPLRGNCGNWKEYGLHISVKRAVQQFGAAATTKSMISELKTLHVRGTLEIRSTVEEHHQVI